MWRWFLLRPKSIEIWLLHLWARLECSPWSQCCFLQWCLRGGNINWSISSSLEKRKKWGRMRCIDRGEVYRHAVLARNWKLLWGSRLIHWKQGLRHLPRQKCTSNSSTYGAHTCPQQSSEEIVNLAKADNWINNHYEWREQWSTNQCYNNNPRQNGHNSWIARIVCYQSHRYSQILNGRRQTSQHNIYIILHPAAQTSSFLALSEWKLQHWAVARILNQAKTLHLVEVWKIGEDLTSGKNVSYRWCLEM